ncbi:hypothetical protein N7519_001132 [Penicillium mononematosum]|uniref:uncharacterized protein n=1 Tax=Penicillium mononematosum TaxID=268346 RepID=UPI002548A276|nr:uncharacterized protein N7519_001132 [Penicillium mononematosum]KAJ6191111.1 hypothetical protein N7519_001132 [Penicillium mononematosum]
MPARSGNHKSNNARHGRTTSWSSGFHLTQGTGESSDNTGRRRRESNTSLASVEERSSSHSVDSPDSPTIDDNMLRNTSMDLGGDRKTQHVRARSISHGQPQTLAPQENELPTARAPTRPRLCRVFDFLQIASLQAYMFYQLKSFDPNLSDSDVATQAGILQGAFTAAQFATAIPWGRVADAQWGGRKFVLLVGLVGTAVSCLGVAYSTSFAQAVFWRSFGGAINGTVGIIRTMIAENVKEKKYHSRAFLILPIGFNIASLFGPVMGGMLADPVKSYPRLFGPNSSFGGANGVQWLETYPYALPMIANFCFLSSTAALVACPAFIILVHKDSARDYDEDGPLLDQDRSESYELEEKAHKPVRLQRVLPFRKIWTKNVLCTLGAQAFFDFQMGAFNNLWLLFLSTPRYDANDPASPAQSLPFAFTGGLGMLPQSVGFATAILGVIGMVLQFTIYPTINGRLGTAKSYQYFLSLFPIAYFIAPLYFAGSIYNSSSWPSQRPLGLVTARTFTLPTSIILLNNCSPHPSVLGTIHGIGQSVSSAFRTIGPIFSGAWYGYGLDIGMVGFAWWLIALVSVFGCLAAIFVYEGSGHEILLPGEEEEI